MHQHKKWRYKNTAFLILALIVLLVIAPSGPFQSLITGVTNLGYLGAFIAGIFFVYIFSVAPAMVVLLIMAREYNPLLVSLFAALGSVIGDYIIFKIFRNRIFDEWAPILAEIKGTYIYKLFHTPYFHWTLPILGALLIASPIPDEIGVGVLGLSRLSDRQFIFLAFLLDFAGLLALVFLAGLV